MITSDTVLYTPSRVADLFPAVYGLDHEADRDEASDVCAAIVSGMGGSSPGVRYVYRREVLGMTDTEIGFAESLDPDTVRERIEQALRFMSDYLNGRFRG